MIELKTIKGRQLVDHAPLENSENLMKKYLELFLFGLVLLFLPSCILGPRPAISNAPQAVINRPLKELEQLVKGKEISEETPKEPTEKEKVSA